MYTCYNEAPEHKRISQTEHLPGEFTISQYARTSPVNHTTQLVLQPCSPIIHATLQEPTRDPHPQTPSHAAIGTIASAKQGHAAINLHVFPEVATTSRLNALRGIEVDSPLNFRGPIEVRPPSFFPFCLLAISYSCPISLFKAQLVA